LRGQKDPEPETKWGTIEISALLFHGEFSQAEGQSLASTPPPALYQAQYAPYHSHSGLREKPKWLRLNCVSYGVSLMEILEVWSLMAEIEWGEDLPLVGWCPPKEIQKPTGRMDSGPMSIMGESLQK
jgi:hypothetical protein